MKINATQASRRGTRERNEDRAVVDAELGFALICDGIGGHPDGEEAACFVTTHVLEWMQAQRARLERLSEHGGDRLGLEVLVSAALSSANEALHGMNPGVQDRLRPGTTASALLVAGEFAVYAWLGDSPIYLSRMQRLRRLTHPHTLGSELVEMGALTADEARRSPFCRGLTRACGLSPEVEVEVHSMPTRPGDRFLLATDGCSDVVPPQTLRSALREQVIDPAHFLVDRAMSAGGRDNATVIVADVLGEPDDSYTTLCWDREEALDRTGS